MGRLTVVIVLNAMFSLMPGISWQAHLGGGVAGFVVAVLLNAMSSGDWSRRVFALVLLVALGVGTVGGLLSAMRWNKAWAGYRQRQADEKFRRAVKEAAEEFDRDVAPLLAQLSPEKEKAAMDVLGYQSDRPGERRNPARVAEARTRLTEVKLAADAVVGHLDVAPVGVEGIDRHRERAKAYAAARSRSFAIVLGMLDSPAIPDAAAWSAWLAAKNEADALWPRIPR